ncbi:MAG: DUF4430 domain-containing protein [Atopobiaceae bacterium]|nr:DUF4430 domain-containing protein [Atopobiaceae bacterium]
MFERKHAWRITTILASIALAFSLCLVPLVGCTSPQEDGASTATVEQTATIDVSVTLDFNSIEEGERTEAVTIEEGSTVLDALEATGFLIDVQDSEYGAYVVAIDGVAAGDHGDESGWLVAVNGEDLMVSADEYQLNDGDVVTWRYVTTFEF